MEKQDNIKYWSQSSASVLEYLKSNKNGLSSEDAELRLKKYGENFIKEQKKSTQLMLFIGQFKNPIIIILIIATGISAATGSWIDSLIILSIILASATLSFFQEYVASNAIAELREKVQSKSVVLRNGNQVDIPSNQIVPGDILLLSAGSLVPADGIILEYFDFFINQSILTGESLPTEKNSEAVPEDASLEDRKNCVFTGTNVHGGSATVLVVRTGENTEFGQIARNFTLRPPENEFERGVRHFGYLLTQMMLILTLIVFAINVLYHRPAIDSLLFSVALAVGITPQLLPAIISITLSKGSRNMAKAGVIVRRLTAIENFGSMDVLCTDKTGTLTEGIIRLDGAVDFNGEPSASVFKLAYLNASLQTGLLNNLDEAIVSSQKLDISTAVKMDEIPFDFLRKRLSIIVKEGNKSTMISKGALSNILNVCSHAQIKDEVLDLNTEVLAQINQRFSEWSNKGIRVMGIAQKPVILEKDYKVLDESGLIFMGFLLLFDHPKSDVSETISELEEKGISLTLITGDNKLIAMHTADSVGLKITGALTGAELMRLSDEALWNKIDSTNLFAEVDPNQKERIILALKKKNHVVGYMGDGINDVPALHAADVSISVNTAVDIAKEAADFVLLENDLEVLNRGIELGRTTFANTLKYIFITTSANFGNMFSMAGASLFMPFLPLLPKQILLINFLTDFPAITIANDSVDKEILKTPRRWNIRFIRDFMFTFGLISSFFDYLAFAVLLIGFKADQGLFQSSWFVVSVLTELLILMVMRTQKPFFKSKPAPILLISTILVACFTMILPYLPFNSILNIYPINPLILLSLVGIALLYIIATEIAKYYFYKSKRYINVK